EHIMPMSFTVGGARGTFNDQFAEEVAGGLHPPFRAGGEREGGPPLPYRGPGATRRARPSPGAPPEAGAGTPPPPPPPGEDGRGVSLPAHVQTVSFPLSAGGPLKCASLPGLRNELAELSQRWDLPQDDDGLRELLRIAQDPDDGLVAEPPEILTFARISLA